MSKNIEKVKNNGKQGITKISTIIVVVVSICSVFGAFYIYGAQSFVNSNKDQANQLLEIGDAVENDIEGIIQTELPKVQQLNSLFREVLRIDGLIEDLKNVNGTGNITVTYNEIEQLAVQAVGYMEQTWKVLETTYAYHWTGLNGGNQANNWTAYDEYSYLIDDVYPEYSQGFQPEILDYAAILYPETKLGQVNEENWYNIMYIDLEIAATYGDTCNDTAWKYDFNLSTPDSYYSLKSITLNYQEKAAMYEQAIALMSTSILLLAISALIVGYLVQIDLKKLKKISLIVGLFVMGIAIGMFGLALFI